MQSNEHSNITVSIHNYCKTLGKFMHLKLLHCNRLQILWRLCVCMCVFGRTDCVFAVPKMETFLINYALVRRILAFVVVVYQKLIYGISECNVTLLLSSIWLAHAFNHLFHSIKMCCVLFFRLLFSIIFFLYNKIKCYLLNLISFDIYKL